MANKYWVAGGDGIVSSTSNWSTASGGSSGAAVPNTSDYAYFDANSGTGTATVTSPWAVRRIYTTGFAGTITGSQPITVTDYFTIDAATTWSVTGLLTLGVGTVGAYWVFPATGFTHPGDFAEGGTGYKIQQGGNLIVNGIYTLSASHSHEGSGLSITAKGGWVGNGSWTAVSRTVKAYITGGAVTGTIPLTVNGCYLSDVTVAHLIVPDGWVCNVLTDLTADETTVGSGATLNVAGNYTSPILRINGSGTFNVPSQKDVNVSDKLHMYGTDTLTPSINTSPIYVEEFVSARTTTMNNTNALGVSYRRLTCTDTGNLSNFTIAFDIVYAGATAYTTFQGNGYLWLPSGFSRYYYFMNPGNSDAYYFTHSMSVGQKYRIVLKKTSGSAMKAYVNGVSKSVGYQGSSANLLTGYISVNSISNEAIGDVLIFNVEKDSDWVASDYAKFQAGGSSTAGAYDSTEPDLLAGWHVDSYTDSLTNTHFNYSGDVADINSFYGKFIYVNASGSSVPVLSHKATIFRSSNIYSINSSSAKTLAYASA